MESNDAILYRSIRSLLSSFLWGCGGPRRHWTLCGLVAEARVGDLDFGVADAPLFAPLCEVVPSSGIPSPARSPPTVGSFAFPPCPRTLPPKVVLASSEAPFKVSVTFTGRVPGFERDPVWKASAVGMVLDGGALAFLAALAPVRVRVIGWLVEGVKPNLVTNDESV